MLRIYFAHFVFFVGALALRLDKVILRQKGWHVLGESSMFYPNIDSSFAD